MKNPMPSKSRRAGASMRERVGALQCNPSGDSTEQISTSSGGRRWAGAPVPNLEMPFTSRYQER